jgi:sugar lactone lactonase YvrE
MTVWMKRIIIPLLLLFVFFAGLALMARMRYGGGVYYQNLSGVPKLGPEDLEVVFGYDEPLGNLAVSKNNRIFFTVHPESRPENHKVLEIVDGKAIPYPDQSFQDDHFGEVLGIVIDPIGRLWIIDHGFHGFSEVKLSAFDLETNELVYEHVFSGRIAEKGSFFNDLQVSNDGRYVFIADVSFFGKNPALVVLDTKTGRSVRLLEGDPSVIPQDWIIQNPVKEMKFVGGLIALKPGIDGIAMDPSGEWLYYGAMAHDGLYKIQVHAAVNAMDGETEPKVHFVGKKPLSDGLSVDTAGRIYITDVEHRGVAVMEPNGSLWTLVKDERIIWADGLSFGGDGWLYFTDSEIPNQMLKTKDHMEFHAPYYIFRMKPEHAGLAGR